MLFSINDDYSIGAYINGEEEFYLMQKGIELDLGMAENNDTRLYRVIYSHRNDEVYNLYRRYIAEALQIIDETRCFIFLFSKIDGMGLCDTYSFTDNKKRILSIVAENQSNFDVISSQLYFYSKEIRTEVIHKGRGSNVVYTHQRMDFLMLLPNGIRVVIEIDGKQHYSEGDISSPKLYAEMMVDTRELQLKGYEVYRFGGYEFMDSQQMKQTVRDFFEMLFKKYSI